MPKIKDKLADLISRSKGAVEGLQAELEANREQRVELLLQRDRIANGPISEDEIRGRVAMILDDAERSVLKGFDFEWLYNPNDGLADKAEGVFERNPLGSLSAFGLRDLIADSMVRKTLSAIPSDAEQLSADEREKRLEAIDAEIHDLAVNEERLVRGMELAGINVQRRADADPAIFLREGL